MIAAFFASNGSTGAEKKPTAIIAANFTAASPTKGSETFLPSSGAPVTTGTERTAGANGDDQALSEAQIAADNLLKEITGLSSTLDVSFGASSSASQEPVVTAAPDPISKTDLEQGAVSSAETIMPPVFHRVHGDPVPELQAQIALVADLETGEAYYELNADKRWPTASITKLMTAAYAMKYLDLSSVITLEEKDFVEPGGDVTKTLKSGESFSVNDLIRAMMTFSSNEAAEAMANSIGRDNFMAGMNNMAQDWQLFSTHFSDPSGLSSANQSTGNDLKVLARNIYDVYPAIFQMTRQPKASILELVSGKKQVITNINQFAGQANFLGGKTGFTDEAGGNLMSLFMEGRRPLFVLVMNTGDRFGDTQKLTDWFENNFAVTK